MFALIVGNPIDGFTGVGPFRTSREAHERGTEIDQYGEYWVNDDGWVRRFISLNSGIMLDAEEPFV